MSPAEARHPAGRIYAALFLVTFATLTFEILLTRIFSVTLWYHFAFIAVSVAMFGMTVGALTVYLRPAWFPVDRTPILMAWSASAFGIALIASVAVHLQLPTLSAARLSATYAVSLVPFLFSGICVCLALTRFPAATNSLYAADLAGAALGCIGFVALLNVMDGLSAVFATAAIAVTAGFVFLPPEPRTLRQAFAVLMALTCTLTAFSNIAFHLKQPLLGFKWVKMGQESTPLFERWNAFSRVTVHADAPTVPVLWGGSPNYQADRSVKQAWLRMDALAGTLLTEFKGDLNEVDYLRYDITNVAHHLRRGGKTLVLGAGGGRDVLSALLFGASEVVAVEINGIILDTVNRRYGEFTGHLDRLPGVVFVHDEARSWTQRTAEHFDIIQASWIDTWAATAAGALALTENSLYTVEAWGIFLDRLSPSGLLTFTRAYRDDDPKEAARLSSLAREALVRRGVPQPGHHIMLVVNQNVRHAPVGGNATILVSVIPFSQEDVARMRSICQVLGFRLAVAPGLRGSAPPLLWAAATGEGLAEIARQWPYRLDAPTDNRPFFFNLLSLSRLAAAATAPHRDVQFEVLKSLLGLLATVAGLSLLCIAAPLVFAGAGLRPRREHGTLVVFFAAIGLGFMFVELALLQRLSLFLGHPSYGIGVVLFGLLLSGGSGSYLAGQWPRLKSFPGYVLLGSLSILIALEALALSTVIAFAQPASTPVRVALSLLLLAPPGVLMGMAFPLGVKAASNARRILPWLWGINGAASVLGSVIVAVVSLELGIAANLWIGAGCYLLAGAMLRLNRH